MSGLAGCVLWTDPEPTVGRPLAHGFELLERFVADSHWSVSLLRCRECGLRYIFEFYEEVDWVDGDDPQYCAWVPVETDADVARVRPAGPGQLAGFRPCLRKDWPKGADAPKIYWVR
jgi:hypothetical protein